MFGLSAKVTFSVIKEIINTVKEEKIEDKEEYLNIKATVIQVNINSKLNYMIGQIIYLKKLQLLFLL